MTIVALACGFTGGPPNAGAQETRPMSLDDLFAIRTLTTVAPAPDGSRSAVVVQRSWGESPAFRPYPMFGNDHADIWLVADDGTPARNLTRGAARRAGYWSPAWSPSGRHLAVLSTEGGDNVRAVLVDTRTGARRRLLDRGVDTRVELGATSDDPVPFRWLDDRRLVVAILPEGAQPRNFISRRQTVAAATEGWRRAHGGTSPSVSVLSTDSAQGRGPAPSAIVVVDVTTLRVTPLHVGSFVDLATSASGGELAVLTQGSHGAAGIILIDTRTGARRMSLIPIPAEQIRWMPTGRLVAYSRDSASTRFDWWMLDSARTGASNLTKALAAEPGPNVIPIADDAIVVASGRALWRVQLTGEAPTAWGSGIDGPVSGIIWPRRNESGPAIPTQLAVVVRRGTERRLYAIDPRTGTASELPAVEGRSRVAAFDPRNRRALLAADGNDATYLWSATAGQPAARRVLAINEHLRAVATSRRITLRYRAANGDSLNAVLLLPPSYDAGTRYPMVTWVYPGVVPRDTADGTVDFWIAKNHAHPDNLHLLAAHGYVVLIPSMPEGPMPRDPYRELPVGVLPAVDAAIAAGIADSARVAVMGQSAGGFATLGLITQTSRFAVAVAIASTSNLVSNYGTFNGEIRYRDDAHLDRIQANFSEGDVIGLGAPPWKDMDRYVRNSPITHVDAVRTPLLLVHGDIDYVPIQQSEEFFTALQRLGRPAEFARYWGESHGGTDSTANARDRWQRVLAWLERWM